MNEFPVIFFPKPSEQWKLTVISAFKHDLVKHTSLSLIPSCVACLGGEKKGERVSMTYERWRLLDEPNRGCHKFGVPISNLLRNMHLHQIHEQRRVLSLYFIPETFRVLLLLKPQGKKSIKHSCLMFQAMQWDIVSDLALKHLNDGSYLYSAILRRIWKSSIL